ncbi:Putative xanthine dehydrogenase molybdenum-binding subunit XdhA [Thalassocella blandensis]|nr:Putative xanthine dehydrogenase molybdenum-binding subunit XdhA [Thalassocella blandensis]
MRKLPEAYTKKSFSVPPTATSATQHSDNERSAHQRKINQIHESAIKHVQGKAQYVDDLPNTVNTLHVATGKATHANAKIVSLNLEKVWQAEGVVDVIVQGDIPGSADVSPVFSGDVLLAGQTTQFVGQPIFAVAATSYTAAQKAVRLAEIEYEQQTPLLRIQEALAQQDFVLPTQSFHRGDVIKTINEAKFSLSGELTIRGQEHFYLEGQISLAQPTEDGGIHVISSSQHPTEVQKLVASVLGVPIHKVQAEVRRMGGGFGGKESQAATLACMAAVFAQRLQQPIKYRMSRQDDMEQTGKRHDFWNQYTTAFTAQGEILAADIKLAGMCGCTADLSDGIVDRAMFHADNAYYLPQARITGYRCRTDTVSNTAFRGFGGPQGMLSTEAMLDDIARAVNLDPLDIRKQNVYRKDKDETPYGQKIEESVLLPLIEQLENTSQYRQRREEIHEFNRNNRWQKRGLALTPVKFGISFTSKHLNQAGALIHVYTDGSIHLNHGGTEMGQGLYTKIKQVVAKEFGVDSDRIMVSAARTDKVPNTSPTAASAGTDLNGMAAIDAVNKIKQNLFTFAEHYYKVERERIFIHDDIVHVGDQVFAFAEFIKLAYMQRVSLSANGFYRTPKIGFDRSTGKGRPFYYFANGAACSEVIVDTMTGEYKITRVDILHDVGESINPAVDIGQIEGGFIQGMGWLTTEELLWDSQGKLMSNSPANYKIPTVGDLPEDFNVNLYQAKNHEQNVYSSKAVGEPPLMLAISVWCALRDACASVADYKISPPLAAPATTEAVYHCMQAASQYQQSQTAQSGQRT